MLKKAFSFVKKFVRENKTLCFFFLLTTIFFIFQHYKQLTWDFSAYVLNARYLFYGGSYFEILRPPLIPTILGIFLFLGKVSEYIFILISSTLFFIACITFSDTVFNNKKIGKEFSRIIFYFFSISAYVLYYGLMAGTELISLGFLILFISFVLRKKVSGHFLALGMLARYNLFMFSPLLFFNKNYKTILKNIGLVFLIFSPWLLFNYTHYGNFIASIIDSLTLNILNRGYLLQPPTFGPFFKLIGWFLPFFLIGVFTSIKKVFKNKKERYQNLILISVTILILYDFITNTQKKLRFLFNFVFPVAYFSSIGTFYLIKKFWKYKKKIVFVIILLFIITIISSSIPPLKSDYNSLFQNAAKDIDFLGLRECEILSPDWVPVNYYTENVYPFHDGSVTEAVQKNKTVLIFKNLNSIDFSKRNFSFLTNLTLYETKDYVFYSNGPKKCSKKYVYNKPYTNYIFCSNLARKFENKKTKEKFEKMCLIFNKN